MINGFCITVKWCTIFFQMQNSYFLLEMELTFWLSLDPRKLFKKNFKSWNDSISKQNINCNKLGSKICLKVYYEELIYKPKLWLKVISQFLNLKWEPNSVNQTYFINWSKKNLLSNETYLWRDSYRNKIEETMKKTRI